MFDLLTRPLDGKVAPTPIDYLERRREWIEIDAPREKLVDILKINIGDLIAKAHSFIAERHVKEKGRPLAIDLSAHQSLIEGIDGAMASSDPAMGQ